MKGNNQINTNGRFFLISFFVVAIDQLTKFLIEKYLENTITIIPKFLSIIYVVNTGAGFGILQGMRWVLIIASLLFVVLVLFYLPKMEKKQLLPMSLIFGGAIGNLIDRVISGGVVDFININHWPAFNIADSAITIGIIWLVIQSRKSLFKL